MSDAYQKLILLIEGHDQATPALRSAGNAAKSLGGELTKIGQIAAGVALGSLGAQLGMNLSQHFRDAITEVQNFGNQVFQMQQRLGLSAQSASGLLSVFERFGVSAEESYRQLDFFSRGLRGQIDLSESAALNGRSFAGTLAELGITAVDAAGHFRPLDEVFAEVQERMSRFQGDGQTAARAMALFSRSGADLAPLLNLSSEEFQRLQHEAQRLGVTLTQQNIGQIRELAMAHHDLDEATRGLTIQTGLLVTGPLTALAKGSANLAAQFTQNVIPAIQQAKDELKVWQTMAQNGVGNFWDQVRAADQLPDNDPRHLQAQRFTQDLIDAWKAVAEPLESDTDPRHQAAVQQAQALAEAHAQAVATVAAHKPPVPADAEDRRAAHEHRLTYEEQLKQLNIAATAGKRALDVVQQQINVAQRDNLDLVRQSATAELALIPIKQRQADLELDLLRTQNQRAQIERETATSRARLAAMPASAALEDNQYQQQLLLAQIKAGVLGGRGMPAGAISELIALKFSEPEREVEALQAGHRVTLAERAQQAGSLRTDIATSPIRAQLADAAIEAATEQRDLDRIAVQQRSALLLKTDKLVDLQQQQRDLEDKLYEVSQRQLSMAQAAEIQVTLNTTVNAGGQTEIDYGQLAKDLAQTVVAALARAQRTTSPGAPTTAPGARLQQGAEH